MSTRLRIFSKDADEALFPELFFIHVAGLNQSIREQQQPIPRAHLQFALPILPLGKLSQHGALSIKLGRGAIRPDQQWWVVSGVAVSKPILLVVEHSIKE